MLIHVDARLYTLSGGLGQPSVVVACRKHSHVLLQRILYLYSFYICFVMDNMIILKHASRTLKEVVFCCLWEYTCGIWRIKLLKYVFMAPRVNKIVVNVLLSLRIKLYSDDNI